MAENRPKEQQRWVRSRSLSLDARRESPLRRRSPSSLLNLCSPRKAVQGCSLSPSSQRADAAAFGAGDCAGVGGGLILVITPSGEHVCSTHAERELDALELKRRIEHLEGTEVERQELLQGNVIRDDDKIKILDGSAVVTLQRGPRFDVVTILTAAGGPLGLSEAGEPVAMPSSAASASASSQPRWRLIEVNPHEFTVQVHEGTHAGKYVVPLGSSPLSTKSRLVLSVTPEVYTLPTKDASLFGSIQWLHKWPQAFAFRTKRRWGGVDGLFWHLTGDALNLAQRARDDFTVEEAFCILDKHGEPLRTATERAR